MGLGDGAILPCMRGEKRLRVVVLGEDDMPLQDVAVVVRQGGQYQRDVTDTSGRCEFHGIRPEGEAGVHVTLADLDADAWETTVRHTLRTHLANSLGAGHWSGATPAPKGCTTHTVDRGDCLLSVGYTHGFLPETLWTHPPNASAWRTHHQKAVLSVGQVIQIPEQRMRWDEARPGTVHVVHRIAVPVVLSIRVVRDGHVPWAHAPFVLALKRATGADLPHRTGVTDQRGFLRVPAPPDVVSGTLIVTSREDGRRWYMPLRVGDLRPADETAGANARLRNLGYRGSGDDARSLDEGALQAFLSDPRATSVDDEVTRKLEDAHLA